MIASQVETFYRMSRQVVKHDGIVVKKLIP